jgi:hypothetical protein
MVHASCVPDGQRYDGLGIFSMETVQSGASGRNFARLTKLAKEARRRFRKHAGGNPAALLHSPQNTVVPYFGSRVKVLMDTCPIYTVNLDQSEQLFQPKYQNHVVTLLALITTFFF